MRYGPKSSLSPAVHPAQPVATSSLDQVSAALPAVASAWEEQGRSSRLRNLDHLDLKFAT
jgi:hypothetical protein